jgi:hypothetical protein
VNFKFAAFQIPIWIPLFHAIQFKLKQLTPLSLRLAIIAPFVKIKELYGFVESLFCGLRVHGGNFASYGGDEVGALKAAKQHVSGCCVP